MSEANKSLDSEEIKCMERIYDDVVMYCLIRKTFNGESLRNSFDLNQCMYEEIINTMFINGVITDISDDGEYKVSDDYNHSNYLLDEELKKEKINAKSEVSSVNFARYFGVLAFIVFCVTAYFSFREPMSLFIVVPLCLLIGANADKVGTVAASIGVIIICIGSLLWVNSKAPIFGERYENKLTLEKYKKEERREKIDEMNQISLGEEGLKRSLKDPSSAEFSGSRLGRHGATCGEVNAKNSFGAYAGYERFIFSAGISKIDDGSKLFEQEWNKYCN